MRKTILILLLSGAVLSLCAQTLSKDSVIMSLRKIRSELSSISTNSKEVKNEIKVCNLVINNILLRLNNFHGAYPAQYVQSLHGLLQLVGSIKSVDSIEQLKFLSMITSDLKIKFMEKPNQMEGALYNDLLNVTIETLGTTGAIKGLRVRYSFLAYKIDYNHPGKSFQRLTSPSNEKLPPGLYEIWVTRDGEYDVLQSWFGEISPDKENTIQLLIKN